jgi:hypothetical protein
MLVCALWHATFLSAPLFNTAPNNSHGYDERPENAAGQVNPWPSNSVYVLPTATQLLSIVRLLVLVLKGACSFVHDLAVLH